ncbi:hypothetical protein J2741_001557 [Methanolinea mesophila]|uniref:hypothetical protein n=1 Tax=Methanolinea mesophila TaxID=547055 RepID=UPI001AEA4BA6|nr:hypothetical protein [Methanolinea mesophila]MBP1929010.1 hypothetical protein [Methanolinea mesophila]
MIKEILVLSAIALVLCTLPAMADTGCPQVPETQGFVTSTAMSAIGTVTETDSVVNIIANYVEEGSTLPYPLAGTTERAEYTSTYTENTIADQGLVTYAKGMTTDTAGAATTGLFNIRTDKVVEFIGTDTGRMTSSENSVLDGAGSAFMDEDIMICPFASPGLTVNPDFCNIVQEGSVVDLTLGSLATDTEQRYIMEKGGIRGGIEGWDLPVSDPGVESNYNIKLTGFGDIPAMGSAESYIDVHVQEARYYSAMEDVKAEDLVYSETSTASGEITLFQKVMSYTSRITAPGEYLVG